MGVGLLFLSIELLILWELSYWVLLALWEDFFDPAKKTIPKRDNAILPPRNKIIPRGNDGVIPNVAQIPIPSKAEQQKGNYYDNGEKCQVNNSAPIRMRFTKFLISLFEDKETNNTNNKNNYYCNRTGFLFPHDFTFWLASIISKEKK